MDNFLISYRQAIICSNLITNARWEVIYRGPDAPMGAVVIGHALNGQWRWRG